jgi:hypothetical protein
MIRDLVGQPRETRPRQLVHRRVVNF